MSGTGKRLGILALLLVGAFVWHSQMAGAAQSITLFVRRTQVESVLEGKTLFAPVAPLLSALGYQWSVYGDGYELKAGKSGGPDIRSRRFVFVYDGKTISPETLLVRGQVWVAVKPIAEAVGGMYIPTLDAGIVQVVFPTSTITSKDLKRAEHEMATRPPQVSKPTTPATTSTPITKPADGGNAPVAASSPAAAASATTDEDKDPVEISKMEFVNNANPSSKVPTEVNGTYVVKNTSDQVVRNIRLQVNVTGQDDQVVAGGDLSTKYISQLDAGESATEEFHWTNYYNLMNVTPKVKMTHDPIKKKETPSPTPSPTATTPLESSKKPTASPSAEPSK